MIRIIESKKKMEDIFLICLLMNNSVKVIDLYRNITIEINLNDE
jgi:hypothetical protein